MDPIEREEMILDEQLENGEITPQQHTRYLNELYWDAQAMKEEEAQQAYDDVMDRGW